MTDQRRRTKRDEIQSHTPNYVTYHNGAFAGTRSWTENTVEVYQEMDDISTPQYKSRSASGEMIFSPMDSKTIEYKCDHNREWSWELKRPGDEWEVSGIFPTRAMIDANTLTPSIDYDETYSNVINDAYSRVGITEAQILASLGELPETLGTIMGICRKAIFLCKHSYNKNLKRMRVLESKKSGLASKKSRRRIAKREIRKLTKQIANEWLELRYGLRPLVIEVQNLLKALEKAKEGPRIRYTSRAEDSLRSFESDSVFSDITNSNSSWLAEFFQTNFVGFQEERSAARTVHISAGVTYTIDPDKFIVALFGLDDIIGTAWELTPFSFIIDWFVNIGRTIDAFKPKAGCTILGSWVTVTDSTVRITGGSWKLNANYLHHDIWETEAFSGGPYNATSRTVSRHRDVGVQPEFSLAITKTLPSIAKFADLGALVISLTNGFRRLGM